ncbi:hypothetical protein [Carboxylicivirga marina]|uniref:hypothetical protein n=1 Tax=Carboxylicivirga marina TaxID=2800988 RepID=UPI0025963EBF|nr:hypothetical protein [uncultured Carboxylicivirga sp.]
MKKTEINLVIIICLIIGSCVGNNDPMIEHYKMHKKWFEKNYKVKDMFEHFPKTCNKLIGAELVINYYKHDDVPNQSACVLMSYPLADYNEHIPCEGVYTTSYSAKNNFINNLRWSNKVVIDEKCNQFYEGSLPIPYFEQLNFGIGSKRVITEIINGKKGPILQYVVPDDLEVYVYKAKNGSFWKEDIAQERPDIMMNWQRGYSRGIALSKKNNVIAYWTMVW